MQQRDQFTSRIGFILASAGSAIGLGNIWRFPYMAGTNGGGAFVLVYLMMLILVGISLLLVEFVIGRHGKANAVECYRKISPRFVWVGYLGVVTSFILLSYYSVVGGWTIRYAVESLSGHLLDVSSDGFGKFFGSFISQPFTPILYLFIFLGMTSAIIARGISKGIERYSKLLMPVLFCLLILLVIRSLSLPGAGKGLSWYLRPDLSKITMGTCVAALSQSFFSLSVGLSSMITYAGYLSSHEDLSRAALWVGFTDTAIAILAGLVIFPAVFAFGMEPASGPGLVFITLPAVFGKMPLGWLFSSLFFVLLVIAALTSSINMMEVSITFFTERWGIGRKKIAMLYGFICFLIGIPASLSFGVMKGLTLFGKGLFDLFDYFCASISNPLSALACAILVGWVWKKEEITAEVTNEGTIQSPYLRIWFPLVKYLAPAAIGIIWLKSIGILKI